MWQWVVLVVVLSGALTAAAVWRSSSNAEAATRVIELKPITGSTVTETTASALTNSVGDSPTTLETPPAPTPPVAPPSPAPIEPSLEPSGCAQPPVAKVVAAPPKPKIITGRVGLFVARFPAGTTDFAPSEVISLNPQGQFPLASNYKQAVLFEVLRQMDQGTLKATERFNVTRGNQSLGYYPFDNTPVLDLALRMIEWSDNTATDILHRRVGLGSLQPIADELRLCNTRLILPTKTWWVAQSGLGGPDFPKFGLVGASRKFAQAPFAEQLEIAKRLDAVAQTVSPDQLNAAIETYFAGRNGGRHTMAEIDRNLQNASTPAEWARFIHHEFMGNALSPTMQQRLRDIAYHGKGRGFIRVPFTYFGGKSGNTARVLTYSGYLETKSGDRLIYVYMNDTSEELATRDQTPQAFYWINLALRKLMRPEDLIVPKPVPVDAKSKPSPAPVKAP